MAFSRLGKNVGIDIGTINTHVFVEGRGIVLSEPSVVATDAKQKMIVAVGAEAERRLQRTPDILEAMTPLDKGVITDYRVTRTMLNYFMQRATGKSIAKSKVILSVPCGISVVEKRAMTDAILQAGAREAYLMEAPVAAALGVGLPIFEPKGSLVVDIGGGTTDVAVISFGGVVVAKSDRVGGKDFNNAINHYIKQCFNVLVAEETVEEIKLAMGTITMPEEEGEVSFLGRDLSTGLATKPVMHRSEIFQIMQEPFARMVEVVHSVLEQTPPELAADIIDGGMVLTGATAMIEGMAERFSEELGIPVYVPVDPGFAVARGLGKAFSYIEDRKGLFVNVKNRKGRA